MTVNIENLAEKVGEVLKKQGLKLVTAESCTGGGLSYWITSIAGSSDWFDRGFITYSDEAKRDLLNVSGKTLKTYGAVSKQTALEMAKGALQNSEANFSIAITGIAGPAGGTQEKPVGTVWIAWASEDFPTSTSVEIFSGDRQAIRARAIEKALETLIEILTKTKRASIF